MSNAAIAQQRALARAWAQYAVGLVALAGLTLSLPSPTDLAQAVTGGTGVPTEAAAQAGNPLEWATLAAAGLLVWGLLGYGVLVGATAVLAAAPGAAGRSARHWLRRIAPAAAGRLVVVGAGACVLAATSACAPGATDSADGASLSGAAGALSFAGSSGSGSTASGATDSAATATGSTASATTPGGASGTVAAPLEPLDIGWPSGSGSQATSAPATGPDRPPATELAATSALAPSTDQVAGTEGNAAPTPAASAGTPMPAGQPSGSPSAGSASAGSASAGSSSAGSPSAGASAANHSADGASADRSAGAPAGTAPTDARQPITVQPGDTLWAIAGRSLPIGATDPQIDETWRQWFAANAAVIGQNPDLILPGQQLLPPDPTGARP